MSDTRMEMWEVIVIGGGMDIVRSAAKRYSRNIRLDLGRRTDVRIGILVLRI